MAFEIVLAPRGYKHRETTCVLQLYVLCTTSAAIQQHTHDGGGCNAMWCYYIVSPRVRAQTNDCRRPRRRLRAENPWRRSGVVRPRRSKGPCRPSRRTVGPCTVFRVPRTSVRVRLRQRMRGVVLLRVAMVVPQWTATVIITRLPGSSVYPYRCVAHSDTHWCVRFRFRPRADSTTVSLRGVCTANNIECSIWQQFFR